MDPFEQMVIITRRPRPAEGGVVVLSLWSSPANTDLTNLDEVILFTTR